MKAEKHFLFGFLLTVVLLFSLPVVSVAQYRIGVIIAGDVPYYKEMHESFAAELKNLMPAGQEIEYILQRPFPDPISLSNAARKLIAFDVNLIVTYGSAATRAVVDERSHIPHIYAGVYDPEKITLNAKKTTGCGFKVPLSSLLRYLKRLEQFDTLTILFSSVEEDSVRQCDEMLLLAEQQGLDVKAIDIKNRKELDQLSSIGPEDAVFVTGSALVHLWMEDIVEVARRQKVPIADIFPDTTQAGVLITLFQPAAEQGKKAAEMAMQILDGKEPKDIPVYVLRDTQLVFNLNEAKLIGIDFPIQLIIEATRVIK